MLASGAGCTVTVTFAPSTAPSAGILQIPVTSNLGGVPVLTNYAVPLTGAYTTEDAGLEILANDVEYGPQPTGATGLTRQFTINNLTPKSLALFIALPRQFALSGVPCSGLAPYASCNFSVSFLPLTNGDITGTLFAQGTPTDGSATLDGLGYVEGYGIGAGTLSITRDLLPAGVLSFGQVPSGQSSQQMLTLTNTSASAPLTVRRVTSEWPFLSTTTCGQTLAPAANCSITVTYSPINQVAPGSSPPPSTSDTGTLVIESDAASSPDLIDLSGSSSPVTLASPSNTAPLAAFTASPSSLTFTSTVVGAASTPQTIELDNTGTATINILGLQATPDFTVTSYCASILPGASCTLTVVFTPQAASQPASGTGTRVGAVEISSNASTSLEFISLAGVSSPSPIALTPASLNFGTVLVGANATLSVQVTNNGSTPAILTGIATTGDYTAANGSCPAPGGSLGPGTSCTVPVIFAPTQSGTRTGTLAITSSTTAQTLVVPLTGAGMHSHLQITPASLGFGTVAVGSSSSLSLTLLNNGTAPITGIALAITGDYSIAVPCAVTALAAGGSCSVTLTFAPSAAGSRPGELTITSSDATSPAAVPLTGVGSSAVSGWFTLTANGSSTASATIASGSPATFNLAVTPVSGFVGTVVLNCTPATPVQYISCSLLPSSITLSGAAQTAVATLNTVTTVASVESHGGKPGRTFSDTALCLLVPGIVFTWKARTSRHPAWRRVGPVAWAVFAAIALLTADGCGGSAISPTNLRYAAAGTYQYQVTASSTSSGAAITQTVSLNLTVR